MPLNPKDFFTKLMPEAIRLQQELGAGPNVVPVFLAQWAHESGFEAANWVGNENYSGLTNGGPPNFRTFKTPEEHTRAQARALTDPNYQRNYGFFLQAAKENASPLTLARLLGASGWSEDLYKGDDGQPGEVLMDIMTTYDLANLPAPSQTSSGGISGGGQVGGSGDAPDPPAYWGSPTDTKDGYVSMPGLPWLKISKDAVQGSGNPILGAVVKVQDKLDDTVFSGSWWLKIAGILIALIVAVLLIYVSIKSMATPAPASEEG